MAEPILHTSYWKRRLKEAKELHHAVFRCPGEKWRAIEEKHKQILAKTIGAYDSVLDCGCAWGRLLDLLPDDWVGYYLGVDLSPDFIELARVTKHKHQGSFTVCDLRDLSSTVKDYRLGDRKKFDWAVMISIRPMVIRNLYPEAWNNMEVEIRKVAKKLLYLEYDVEDEGSIE